MYEMNLSRNVKRCFDFFMILSDKDWGGVNVCFLVGGVSG